jgi:hypothetical protein
MPWTANDVAWVGARLAPDAYCIIQQANREQRNRRLLQALYGELTMATPIDRLKEKFAKASGVAGRVTAHMESKADALIAREDALIARSDKAFAPHNELLDAGEHEMDAVESALSLMSNGGPPLHDAGNTEHDSKGPPPELAIHTIKP